MAQRTGVVHDRFPNGRTVGMEIPGQFGGNVCALAKLYFDDVRRVIDGLAEDIFESPRGTGG